jgi:hypothetical protein
MPTMKSQFEECGATMSTIFGKSGMSPTMRHPNSRKVQ